METNVKALEKIEWDVRHPDQEGVKTDRHGRRYKSTHTEYDAQCDDCEWIIDGRNGLGLATQHHDRTGHQIKVWFWKRTTYFRSEPSSALEDGASEHHPSYNGG